MSNKETDYLSVNNPLPEGGNGAGAVAPGAAGANQSAGALGQGSVTASALVNMFDFLAYVSRYSDLLGRADKVTGHPNLRSHRCGQVALLQKVIN